MKLGKTHCSLQERSCCPVIPEVQANAGTSIHGKCSHLHLQITPGESTIFADTPYVDVESGAKFYPLEWSLFEPKSVSLQSGEGVLFRSNRIHKSPPVAANQPNRLVIYCSLSPQKARQINSEMTVFEENHRARYDARKSRESRPALGSASPDVELIADSLPPFLTFGGDKLPLKMKSELRGGGEIGMYGDEEWGLENFFSIFKASKSSRQQLPFHSGRECQTGDDVVVVLGTMYTYTTPRGYKKALVNRATILVFHEKGGEITACYPGALLPLEKMSNLPAAALKKHLQTSIITEKKKITNERAKRSHRKSPVQEVEEIKAKPKEVKNNVGAKSKEAKKNIEKKTRKSSRKLVVPLRRKALSPPKPVCPRAHTEVILPLPNTGC